MTSLNQEDSEVDTEGVEAPQGHKAGVPYDLRRPTVARYKARMWNRDDHRMFPPKVLGFGWTINFYWVFHLMGYVKARGAGRSAH
jgi:hypothetical protein